MTNTHCEHSPRPWMKASPTEGYDLSTLKATQPDAALIARAIEVPHDGDPDCPGVRNKAKASNLAVKVAQILELKEEKVDSAINKALEELSGEKDKPPVENNAFIKHFNSKGPRGALVALTVADVRKGYIVDFAGYKNEVVLFLRKNRGDRQND